MEPETCDACGYLLDAATGVGNDDSPEEGNVSVCLKCGAIRIFAENAEGALTRRKPTVDEELELMADEDLQALATEHVRRLAAIQQVDPPRGVWQ